jgi:hypothetical protein
MSVVSASPGGRGAAAGGGPARWSESTGWTGLAYECWLLWRGWWRGLAARRRPRPEGLSIAARLDLGARRSLLVVVCGGRRFLVAAGAEAVSAIAEIGPPPARRGGGRGCSVAPHGTARGRRPERPPTIPGSGNRGAR